MPSGAPQACSGTLGPGSPVPAGRLPAMCVSAPRSQEPWRRFTYSQNYLSATLGPQDPEEEEKDARKRRRQAWLTPSGFQVPGLHSGRHLGLLPTAATAALPEVRGAGLGRGVGRDPPLTPGSPLRNGGNTPCLPTCCSRCWTAGPGAGTCVTATSTCTGSHRPPSSCPPLPPRAPRQVRRGGGLCSGAEPLFRRARFSRGSVR